MLVLSRKLNERIIAGEITFTIVGIRGGKVQIGVEAPKHLSIVRSELLEETAAVANGNN